MYMYYCISLSVQHMLFVMLHTDNCVWLVPVVAPHPLCTYQPDCQSIVCITFYGDVKKVTLSLDSLCADPLSVEFTEVKDDGSSFRQTFTESTRFDYGFVTMQRSATQLNFSVSHTGYVIVSLSPSHPTSIYTCTCVYLVYTCTL